MDEVADINGRVALLVGQFNLDRWLDGALIRSLLINPPEGIISEADDVDKHEKSPSFARIRRIWETTRKFWQDVLPTEGDIERSLVGWERSTSDGGRSEPSEAKLTMSPGASVKERSVRFEIERSGLWKLTQ